jgi:hypothetical protein
MTPEDERDLFKQLVRIERKIDWIAGGVISAAVMAFFYFLHQSTKGTWASELVGWISFPLWLVTSAILLYSYHRIETLQRKAEERRDAAELERQHERERQIEEKIKDLERRWREFRGAGLFPHKECREWASSRSHVLGETLREWREFCTPRLLFEEDDLPPFIYHYEIDNWKRCCDKKLFDCQERREARGGKGLRPMN